MALCSDALSGSSRVRTPKKRQTSYVIQQVRLALTIGAERVFHNRLADDCEAISALRE